MKNLLCILIMSGILIFTLPVHAQIGDIKKNVSKVKDKASESKKSDEPTKPKETTKPEETNKPASSSKTEETPKETTSKAASTPKERDFTELEKEKMEWSSLFDRLAKKWDVISYEEYTTKKAEYQKFYEEFAPAYKKNRSKEHSDTYTLGLIAKIDAMYTETVPEAQMTSLKNSLKRAFDENDWTVYPSDRLKDIENAEKQISDMKGYLIKTDPHLEAYEKTVKEQKDKIIAYVESGGLAKRDAEIEKRLVETRRLHKAGMTDESVVATVNSKIDKARYGTPQRVVITSTSWEVERNQFGIVTLKFARVDIATKKADGKCYYIKGSVAQTHEGGGRYGDKYLNIYYTEGEMNCANVNK